MTGSGFPDDFLWGAATSAYQVEGAALEDGKGPSIWDRFSHLPGRIAGGETGDVACDHYHRFRDDVALMAELGLNTYRFSIAWSRVLPDGRGSVNRRGLDFYSQLVDALLERGIRPNATLYHWDLPAALDDRGGWTNPDSAGWFGDYAHLMYRTLGDRVPMWATLNEPWVVVDAGYVHGVHAPGTRSLHAAARAAHNLLRAHGTAVQAFRAESSGRIGIVVNLEPKYPATESEPDLAAVQRADAYMNRFYLDPVFRGSYPDELRDIFGDAWLEERDERDMALIREPIDFLGINFYKRGVTRHDASAWPTYASLVPQPQHLMTVLGPDWEVYPPALTRILLWVKERYGDIPLYITENGAAFPDPPPGSDGRIDDPLRTSYIRDHLIAAQDAMRQGVDLRGWYVWSLLDNFEWSAGYAPRFGIVHVDYPTLARTPKASALWYADVISGRGTGLREGPR